MCYMKEKRIRKKQFTLMELLIVVAIVGILLSILLPSLQKSREKARIALCLSNQSQVYRNLFVRSQENDNQLPERSGQYGIQLVYKVTAKKPEGHGYLVFEAYTNGEEFYCPSSTDTDNMNLFNRRTLDKKYGGYPVDWAKKPTSTIRSSYAYRATIKENNKRRQASVFKDNPGTAIMTELFTDSKYSTEMYVTYLHKKGYVTTRLDGSVTYVYDQYGAIAARNVSRHPTGKAHQETVWNEYFDEQD